MQENLALCALNLVCKYRTDLAHKLLDYYGSAAEVFAQTAPDLQQDTGLSPTFCSRLLDPSLPAQAQAEWDWAHQKRVELLTYLDPDFPPALLECPDHPLVLYRYGNWKPTEDAPLLSVVGTRSATQRDQDFCAQFIKELGRRVPQLTVVSGLALGIDACAHRAALEAGLATVAVLPNGLDHVYPALHRSLAAQISRQGALLTEFPSQTENYKHTFLQRNRLIAGLSQGTLVAASKADGGGLITAHLAFEYQREVFAFPGRPTDPTSVGCNRLIQDNKALLVTTPQDLIDALGWRRFTQDGPRTTEVGIQNQKAERLDFPLSEMQEQILACVGQDGGTLDALYARLNLSVAELSAQLTELELMGFIGTDDSRQYYLR